MLEVDNTEIFDWLKDLNLLLKILKTVTSIFIFFPVVIKEIIGVCFVRHVLSHMHKPMQNFWNVALLC